MIKDATLELLMESKMLTHYGSGKVREMFELPDYPNHLLVYVTDRWSARDFIFGFGIDGIGEIRNAMTIHWKRRMKEIGVKTDLVAYGRYIDSYLPPQLKHNRDLWKRATIVKKYGMIPHELIYRFNSVGGVQAASEKGMTEFCGNSIKAGMQFGTEFFPPLRTPTIKAKVGHDPDENWQDVEKEYPGLLDEGAHITCFIHDMLAVDELGNLIDIKLEMAVDPVTGQYVLCDEVSPDSCRFTNRFDYGLLLEGNKHAVEFLDKEFGRSWADERGIKEYDPSNLDHCREVATWTAEPDFFLRFISRYNRCFFMNTGGHDLAGYHRDAMGL
jgi:phosphoribosylaminoimidazole-succinocarboxamide synthase